MKNIIKGIFLLLSVAMVQSSHAQEINATDSTGLAGDHFSLQGAMELFKKAKSPEAFETALNNEKNAVNNLDLNEDGKTDYVKVKDIGQEKSRVLVLQVDVNARETQDVAVITIEKTGDATAAIQIKGAEELYGEDKLIEPMEEKVKGGKGGPDAVMNTYFVWVNVWYWPCVQYIYAPTYVYWYSPWYWNYYPTWWSPWYARPWRTHYHACYHYQPYYHQVYEYRNYDGYALYGNRKSTASSVQTRYERSAYRTKQAERKQQPVIGREKINAQSKATQERQPNGTGKTITPNRDIKSSAPTSKPSTQGREKESINKPSGGKEVNSERNTPAQGKPTEVRKENRPRQEKANAPQSKPGATNKGRESAAPSKAPQPSKQPSIGRSQPQGSGKAAPQRSAPSQRSSGNSGRRK